jgi:hypothetical protein
LLEPVDAEADQSCALGQPDPAVARAVALDVERGEPLVAVCEPRGEGRFVSARAPDPRVPVTVPLRSSSVDVRETTVDGEPAFVARWTPPEGCRSGVVPRVRVVDAAEPVRTIADDGGAGITVERDGSTFRVTWTPDDRERSRTMGRAFRFELALERPSQSPHVERSEPFDPTAP